MKKLFIALLCACLCATSFAQPRFGHPQNYKHHSSHEDRYYEEFQDNNRPDIADRTVENGLSGLVRGKDYLMGVAPVETQGGAVIF